MISFLEINDLGDENEDEERHAACMGGRREMHTHLGGELEGKK